MPVPYKCPIDVFLVAPCFFPANMCSAHFSTFVPRSAFCCSSCFARCSHRCCPRSRPKKSTFPEDPSLPGTIPSESLPCGHLIWVLFQEVRAHWLVLWAFASICSAAAGTCQGLAWPKATAGPAQCTHHGRRLKRSPSLTPKPSKNFLALVSNWETAWTCLGLRTEHLFPAAVLQHIILPTTFLQPFDLFFRPWLGTARRCSSCRSICMSAHSSPESPPQLGDITGHLVDVLQGLVDDLFAFILANTVEQLLVLCGSWKSFCDQRVQVAQSFQMTVPLP